RDTEPMQIIEPPHQALEITDAIPIGVHVGPDGQAIDDGVLVPKIFDHHTAAEILSLKQLSSAIVGNSMRLERWFVSRHISQAWFPATRAKAAPCPPALRPPST